MLTTYVVFIPLLFCILSATFLRYADLHVVGAAAAGTDLPSAVLRIEGGGVVTVNGVRTPPGQLDAAIRKADPPFGSTALVSGRGGTVADVVAVIAALRRTGVAALLVDR